LRANYDSDFVECGVISWNDKNNIFDTCYVSRIITLLIKQFKHKGLETFFNTGNTRGINPEHADKIARILDRLDTATNSRDMNLPGYKLHKLKGKEKDIYSVWVNGNWRITFKFIKEDAYIVDYRDYH